MVNIDFVFIEHVILSEFLIYKNKNSRKFSPYDNRIQLELYYIRIYESAFFHTAQNLLRIILLENLDDMSTII